MDVRATAKILGGERSIGRVRSVNELGAAVARGLPKSALLAVARAVYPDVKRQRRLMHTVVPEATLKRRREKLSVAESERTERLARITAQALRVWGDEEDGRAFLTESHPLLGGRAPIDAAGTDLGARQVEQILNAIEYGLPV